MSFEAIGGGGASIRERSSTCASSVPPRQTAKEVTDEIVAT